ncbi:hypothetical protein EDB89DRAFT_1175882 [Lactarius sanguifluus]|nr:hypothetical protein EDB89DRAFT_1175882 [Lactarius sanguifluus]
MKKLGPRQCCRSGMPIPVSHECQGQECCIYHDSDSDPVVPIASTYNSRPTPFILGNLPLSIPQSSRLHQDISSHFPNNDDGFFPSRYHQGVPVTSHPIALETSLPAGAPNAPGVARSSTFYERVLVSDSPNAVTNEPMVNPISDVPVGEGRFPPSGWTSSHMALRLLVYDPQNTMPVSDVLYMSYDAQSPNPQLHSTWSPDHPPTSLLSDLLTCDSLQEPEAEYTELSPAIQFSTEVSPVPPAVAGKEKRCRVCGISFTQLQVLNRHMKDKHEDKMSCPHCLNFKWSRGRPYLYRRHLRARHSGLASSEDPPVGTRNAQVLRARARQCKVPNKENQVTFREPLIPYLGDRCAHE